MDYKKSIAPHIINIFQTGNKIISMAHSYFQGKKVAGKNLCAI